ncbi:MAG: peptidoglycan editing factor PgeF [Pseudomonadota bacterium]
MHPDWLRPEAWPAEVGAVMTTRAGGASAGAYASMNLGAAVGDDPEAVRRNRAQLAQASGARPVWLKQVHGARVVNLDRLDPEDDVIEADASIATRAGVACVVGVADCLPVLLAAPGGRGVGAAHAGWRGLAGGVLENTVATLCEAAGCEPQALQAWMGACIGPQAFEVGPDVLQAFGADADAPDPARFVPRVGADGRARWLANLPRLATDRLRAAGVEQISGGGWCTVSDASRFFSFRRDRITGRMAAAVWLRG